MAEEEEKNDLLDGENLISAEQAQDVYPNAEVRVSKVQYSTVHLKRLVEERHEMIVAPDFQRNNVWHAKQSAELVESILMGIPIPVIYLFEMRNGNKQVVDGRQRITTILDFLNNNLTLKELKILPQCNGKKFCDLEPKLQGVFEDYQLSFYIIQPPTPERVKYDIFDRVNRGGTQLTKQEMRCALYKGKVTDLLYELSQSSSFLNATEKGINPERKKDQYVILRAIAFYLYWKMRDTVTHENGMHIEYKSDIDDFLARMMIYINEKASQKTITQCRTVFLTAMENCHVTMGSSAFRFRSKGANARPIHMLLFEVLMYIFTEPQTLDDKDYTLHLIEDFKTKADEQQFFGGNADSKANVEKRYKKADELLHQIKDDKQAHTSQL